MPIITGICERIRTSYHHLLNLTNGGTCRYVVCPARHPASTHFFLCRIRMEIVECLPDDLPKVRRCLVRLLVNNAVKWDGPASRLLLEDWLRKELRNIKKGKNRSIEKYLGRILISSFGQLEPLDLSRRDEFLIELSPDHTWTAAGNISVRFFAEGIDYREVELMSDNTRLFSPACK